MRNLSLLQVRDLCLDSPGGRPLFRDLTMNLGAGERIALVGRNGVGKSSLLDVLAGGTLPEAGLVSCNGRRLLVPQQPQSSTDQEPGEAGSPGELRRRLLQKARDARPDLLLLDEPTHDLDRNSIDWLVDWLERWEGGLIVVSHDRRVLRIFREFFVVAESGCRHFRGGFDSLMTDLVRRREEHEERYVRTLNQLLDKEKRCAKDRQRRQRKKNLGRVRELGRSPSRIKLNDKRSYAQEKQGKRFVRREARIAAARTWAKATRRALSVELPLELALPRLPEEEGSPVAVLQGVAAFSGERVLFEHLSLGFGRERLAITGPNGSGKTTLIEILIGDRKPDRGRARSDTSRIGYVAQNAGNWCSNECIVDLLMNRTNAASADHAARVLRAHRFPFALAQRPLISLSPGERLRAGLICLGQRCPAPELLVLDEPTDHLDFLGKAALESVLAAWRGGLVVASHDDEFLMAIGMGRRLELGLGHSAGASACWSFTTSRSRMR